MKTNDSFRFMEFIAYLTYNNNGSLAQHLQATRHEVDIRDPLGYATFEEMDGHAVMFRWRYGSFKQQLIYYSKLDELLKAEFGCGFSVVLCPTSDCSRDSEIEAFCLHMKSLNPDTITLVHGSVISIIPEDIKHEDGPVAAWNREPYKAAITMARLGLADEWDTPQAEMKPGIDYFTKAASSDGKTISLVDHLLKLEPEPNGKMLDPETLEKIASITRAAFALANNLDYDRSAPALVL